MSLSALQLLNMQRKTSVADIKAEIEFLAEKGQVYAKLVSDTFGVNLNKAGNYLRELTTDGTLEKVPGRIMLAGSSHQMYRIATEDKPIQRTMEMVVIRRDPLVEALFGPA